MPLNPLKEINSETKFTIIGAGASGLFSARALKKSGADPKNITILDIKNKVGGKCDSFKDPTNPNIVTERGAALVASNYQFVLDAIQEKKITLEEVISVKETSMDFMRQYVQKDTLGKLVFTAEFSKELVKYELALREYLHARDNNLPLPKKFELPFAEFAKLEGLNQFNEMLRPFVTGFGYGAMQECPTFAVFEYMGHTTHIGMGLTPKLLHQGPFYAIKGGFQRLMEAIAEDFDVKTSAKVLSIQRNSKEVTVAFQHEGETQQIKSNYLILALSPLHWPKLGMTLSDTEQLCAEQVTYYRYPIAIGYLKGYPVQQEFFEKGLQPQGFRKLSLITTRDARPNPQNGRLCTFYVNNQIGANDYNLSLNTSECNDLLTELLQVEGVTDAKIVETHTWEDYMSMLSWDLRCQLQSKQFTEELSTGYVGSFLSFEDVACVAACATKLIAKHFAPAPQKIFDISWGTEISRMWGLFKAPKQHPVTDDYNENLQNSLITSTGIGKVHHEKTLSEKESETPAILNS